MAQAKAALWLTPLRSALGPCIPILPEAQDQSATVAVAQLLQVIQIYTCPYTHALTNTCTDSGGANSSRSYRHTHMSLHTRMSSQTSAQTNTHAHSHKRPNLHDTHTNIQKHSANTHANTRMHIHLHSYTSLFLSQRGGLSSRSVVFLKSAAKCLPCANRSPGILLALSRRAPCTDLASKLAYPSSVPHRVPNCFFRRLPLWLQ